MLQAILLSPRLQLFLLHLQEQKICSLTIALPVKMVHQDQVHVTEAVMHWIPLHMRSTPQALCDMKVKGCCCLLVRHREP
jgi:hypothetical protein